ncbi:MAG TPA: hypothetical protein VF421_17265, partial [Niabella sp.]
APLAWWVMNKWLQEYSYRTTISASAFILSGGVILLVAMITIITQTLRAAVTNPSKAIRSE